MTLALSGAVFSTTALSTTPQSHKESNDAPHIPTTSVTSDTSDTAITVKQLLHEIDVLERDFALETRAMEALDARIAQIESQYQAVKSRIEQQFAYESLAAESNPTVHASLSQSQVPPLPAPSAQHTMPEQGVGGNFAEHADEAGTATSALVAYDAQGTYVAAGGLVVLVCLLILNAYRRKRANARGDENNDATGAFLDAQTPGEEDKGGGNYLHSLRKLMALRKAAQHAGETDESTVIIKSDQYQQRQHPQSDRNKPSATNSAIADARRFIAQNKPEQAVQALESFLTKNKDSEIGWQLLFKLLFELKQKNAFRKHALRFKRHEQFPDIWEKVRIWGHALEPDETLYMTEQEKKQRFFSD